MAPNHSTWVRFPRGLLVITVYGDVKPGAMSKYRKRKNRRKWYKVNIHACWRDEECQSLGAPKRLYINFYFGSLQISKVGRGGVSFHRSHPKREREWRERGLREGWIQEFPDGSTLVKLKKPIVVRERD